ncbi:MAG: DUF6089 family protein [Bacteroidota bacterium]|nr:DUF6089 family protein [Bacteroidota bacterium]
MKKLFLLFSLIFYSLITSLPANAQFGASEARRNFNNSKANDRGLERYKRYTSIGGSFNAFNYFGDLAPWDNKFSTDLDYTRPGLGLVIMRRLTPRISWKATYTYGRLRADDFSADHNNPESRDRYRRNLHFRNEINELAFNGVFDFVKNKEDYFLRSRIVPYAYLGVALFHHNPKAQLPVGSQVSGADWVALRPLQTEGKAYSRIQIATPIGVGARIKLAPRLDLSAEIGLRQLYFDYLDDVSNVYIDPGSLDSDLARTMASRAREAEAAAVRQARDPEIVQNANTRVIEFLSVDGNTYSIFEGNSPGRKRGNPNDNDIYVVTSLQLTYIFLPRMYRAKYRN